MEWFVKTVLAAVISFLIPLLFKRILPGPDMARQPVTGDDTSFPWGRWIWFLAVAGGLAGIVSGVMGLVLGGVANWAVFGAAIGIVQWFILYRLINLSPWFALASTFGWGTFIFVEPIGHPTWAVIGLLVGSLQWLALRGSVKGSFWWIPANALAWFIAGMAGIAIGIILTDMANSAIAWVAGWTVVGGIGASVLSIALNWMWKRTTASV